MLLSVFVHLNPARAILQLYERHPGLEFCRQFQSLDVDKSFSHPMSSPTNGIAKYPGGSCDSSL
jgi:hypothetical protein